MRIVNYQGTGCTFDYFDSLSSVANVQVAEVNMERWRDTIRNESEDWLGIKGGRAKIREVVELYGWSEGVDRGIETFLELQAPNLPSRRKKRCHGSSGHTLNLARMYSGSFEKMWATSQRELTNKKMNNRGLVTIAIDISTSCGISGDAYFWRGALGMCLTKALMESGRKVRVLACNSTRAFKRDGSEDANLGEKNLTAVVLVKDFNQPLELNSMFAITALSGFYRHYIFKVILSMPCQVDSGLGRPDTLRVENMAPIMDDSPTLIIENIWNKETAVEKASKIMEELKA